MTRLVAKSSAEAMVRGVIGNTLEGLGMEVEEFGIAEGGEVKALDAVTGIRRLLTVDNGVALRTRFAIGDLYNRIPKKHGLREEVAQLVYGDGVTEVQRHRLRTYGWVAKKWPREARSDQHPWSWWIANAPGKSEAVRKAPPRVELIPETFERLPLETVVQCRDTAGKGYTLRVPRSAEFLSPETIEPDHYTRDKVIAFLGE